MSDNGSETPVVDNVEVEETQVQETEAPKGKMSVEVSLHLLSLSLSYELCLRSDNSYTGCSPTSPQDRHGSRRSRPWSP